MKRVLLSALVSAAVAVPALANLKEGDAAPDFKTQASLAGKEFTFSLKNALKKGPVVVYFYPAAYTKGCDLQAHTFSEDYEKFAAAHATIIGVSLDKIATLNKFSSDPEFCAGHFPVASDSDGKIAKSFDVTVMDGRPGAKNIKDEEIDHGFADRITFVVLPSGKVAATIGGKGVAPDANVHQALETVQKLGSGK
jgi:peroxiredoxin Q/BCP